VKVSLTGYKLATTEAIRTAGRGGKDISAAFRKADAVPSARVKTKQLCLLSRQLATLLQAGMPIVPAFSALLEQYLHDSKSRRYTQNEPFVKVLQQIRDRVNAGASLSQALSACPGIFSPLFVNMVAAGEVSGNLEDVLMRIAAMLEKRIELAGKVKAAVAYPLMMIMVAAGVVVFLFSYVVPGITRIFLEMNHTLPGPTRLLIAVSSFAENYLLLLLLGVCGAVVGIGAVLRSKEGRAFADRLKLKMPLFGKLLLKAETARLTRTLAVLLSSGIPILRALEIVRNVTTNSVIAKALDSVKESVSRGDSFAEAVRKTSLFPPIVFHLTATAQANANIEQGLANLADMYDVDVENTARVLTSLLEPAILLVMGAVVGFIVLAILLPIFEINQAL